MKDIVTRVDVDKRGALVTVNETEALWFSKSLWRERSLSEQEEVELDELKGWLSPRQYAEALNAAVRFLAVRSRSELEVRQKLESYRYLDDVIDAVLYKLQKNKLLNDESFAREWALTRAHQNMGKNRIIMELRHKGISSTIAQRVIDELPKEERDDGAAQMAAKLIKRYGSQEPKAAMNKIMAAMARRGYGYEDAKIAVESALHAIEDED